MPSQLIISATSWDVRAALVEDGRLVEFHLERPARQDPTGNIYLGRVLKVLPGMAAAFLDVGLDRPGYLFAQEAAAFCHDFSEFWLQGEADEADAGACRRLPAPPITDLLTPGQTLLVQVCRPPLGAKGARLTTHISLPGRYLVYLPTVGHLAVSRRLVGEEERRRLKGLVEELKPAEGGLIARTASAHQTRETLTAEREALVALWRRVRQKQAAASAPAVLHQELPLIRRLLRDLLSPEVVRLVVDDPGAHEEILSCLKLDDLPKPPLVELYRGSEPVFSHFHIDPDWRRLLAPQVWLKSGGYLLIEATEALTAIDVNTGRFTGRRDLEDTILTTNLEAAREIPRQLRLRNLSGLIVIDFIDMELPPHRDQVMQTLHQALGKDRARTTVYPMSPLGLVEMTRQRLRDNLEGLVLEPCECCQGRGARLSSLVIAHDLLRQLTWEAGEFPGCRLAVAASPEVLARLQRHHQEILRDLEARHQVVFHFSDSPRPSGEHFTISRELPAGGKKV